MAQLDAALDATDRIDALVTDLANVVTQRELVDAPEPVDLEAAFRSWGQSKAAPDTLEVVASRSILADKQALVRLADNLVKNSTEHGGTAVSMRLGTLEDGFYYEDSGPGIPVENRSEVFKPGFSTKADGTGLGMVSVEQIATAHGWDVTVTESDAGGARFEFTGVTDPT